MTDITTLREHYYIRPLKEVECLKFSRVLKWVSTFGGAPLLGLSPVLQVMTIAAKVFWPQVLHIVGESILYIVPARSTQIGHFPQTWRCFARDSHLPVQKYFNFEPVGISRMMCSHDSREYCLAWHVQQSRQ